MVFVCILLEMHAFLRFVEERKTMERTPKGAGKRRKFDLFFSEKKVGSQERNPPKISLLNMGKEVVIFPTAQLDMLVPQQGGPQELDEAEELDEEERKALGGPG